MIEGVRTGDPSSAGIVSLGGVARIFGGTYRQVGNVIRGAEANAGGVVYGFNANLFLVGNDVEGCRAPAQAGAFSGFAGYVFASSSSLLMANERIVDAHAETNWGLVVAVNSSANIVNSTIVRATSAGPGQIASVQDGEVTVANSVFAEIESGPTQFLFGKALPDDKVAIAHSYVAGSGGSSGWNMAHVNAEDLGGNLDGNAGFVDAASGNYRLLPTSMLVNAGSLSYLPADVLDLDDDGDTTEPLPVDFDGRPRVVGSSVDMGAFESELQVMVNFGGLRQMVKDLVDAGRNIPARGQPLYAKIDAAEAAYSIGDHQGAIVALTDFINQTRALVRARRLPDADAQALIAEAERLIALLR